ncbi:PPOX class F420-dependent oxidoreductase [Microlunatus parietis]|uniref:Pyridoxamine 5'-phosphate oxidase N-terminal domain-containing protein n=1 Tax=Microlunatus parietis TaxID=682979 RepID=A0A7Y9I4G7_9ACTN|nr:PPOX class F420-dependent oxidoreductase [Microlunatus parietis]NYE70074.1 hypothetical protein [Microlunatus parietis]
MTDAEWRAFVSDGTRTGKLSTVRRDGSPHIAPMWFLLDGDRVMFNTDFGSVKARNLRRDNRYTFCIDSDQPPFAFVVISGTAHLTEGSPLVEQWASRIGARYMGQDRAAEFGTRNGGELLVQADIDTVIAYTGVTD